MRPKKTRAPPSSAPSPVGVFRARGLPTEACSSSGDAPRAGASTSGSAPWPPSATGSFRGRLRPTRTRPRPPPYRPRRCPKSRRFPGACQSRFPSLRSLPLGGPGNPRPARVCQAAEVPVSESAAPERAPLASAHLVHQASQRPHEHREDDRPPKRSPDEHHEVLSWGDNPPRFADAAPGVLRHRAREQPDPHEE